MQSVLKHLSTETVQQIIRLAKACPSRGKNAPHSIEAGAETEAETLQSSKDHAPDPEEIALVTFLKAVPGPAMHELTALMILGRGAGGETAADWEWLVKHAEGLSNDGDAGYLASKLPLPEYLERGRSKLDDPSSCPQAVESIESSHWDASLGDRKF